MITDFDQLDLSKKYTYAEYLTWQFQERVELFLGKVFRMSPAPNVKHQRLLRNLFVEIVAYSRKKKCQTFCAPFDVRLPVTAQKGKTDTVVQPDIVVICDEKKLDEQGCNGAPDLIVEILSPGNSTKEMKHKFELYETSLVLEYWIVDPVHEDVTIYSLNTDRKYIGSKPYVAGESVSSAILTGFEMKVEEIFKK